MAFVLGVGLWEGIFGWGFVGVKISVVLIEDGDVLLVHFEEADFVRLQILDLLGHPFDPLLQLEVLHFEEVRLFAILLLETVGNLVVLLGGWSEVGFVEEGVVEKMGLRKTGVSC